MRMRENGRRNIKLVKLGFIEMDSLSKNSTYNAIEGAGKGSDSSIDQLKRGSEGGLPRANWNAGPSLG